MPGTARGAMLRQLQKTERWFDRAFGAAGNPWRHLGALGFFLFWVITASGIYLYAFFDTSVEGAYRSVEALTHDQRYAGGVMRSLHRYASDAFVIVVVLHVVKEFLHRRYAGFRWFSWLTGVPLLWFMFASGIGGYWLVWDGLAQFIAIATTEWFDWLDLFGEPLARNFLYPESINSRFFTLLIFLHIGIPLALLLGMFIHVQRVSEPDTLPARSLGWGALAALLALSLCAPATSMEPAELARMPQQLQFDWYYLFAYPLIYAWSPAAVWTLAGLATAALAALPWLARGGIPAVAQVDIGNCNGCARCFADCPYAAVVMRPRAGGKSGQQHAVVMPGLCASCGICAGACPSSTPFRRHEQLTTGIDMPQFTVHRLRAQLEDALARLAGERRIVVFGCDCAADVGRIKAPHVAAFSLLCTGQLPPSFVEYALRSGADGIFVTGCRRGDCQYRTGNALTEARLHGGREPHLRANVAPQRVRVAWYGKMEEAELKRDLERFTDLLKTLPPGGTTRSARRWRVPAGAAQTHWEQS
jgi:coenzyme F420-reducing hydrogenase delta subunit/quinol-cytochrome oxidoreductase complex cytochrome b subunit